MENTQQKYNTLEQAFTEAESRFREGLDTLSKWTEQTSQVMKDRPGALVASIAIAGFVTGISLRQSSLISGQPRPREGGVELGADPLISFLSGALAGFVLGPRLLRSISKSGEQVRPLTAV